MAEKQRAELPSQPKTTRSLKAIVSKHAVHAEESRQNQPSQLAAARKKMQYQNNRDHMSYFEKLRMMIGVRQQRQTVGHEETTLARVSTLEDDKTERSVSQSRQAANRLSLAPSKRKQNLTSEAPPHPLESLKHTLLTKNNLPTVKPELFKYRASFESICEQPVASFAELQLSETLGVGAGACVRLALDRTTQHHYAVKIYEKYKLLQPRKMKSVRREIKLLQQLRHPNIISLLNAYESKRQIHLVMEYFEGVTLLQHFRNRFFNLAAEEAKHFVRLLLWAVREMHATDIAHRDIKLDNVLVRPETGELKLIDFGFATSAAGKCETNCGTPNYMAPELFEKTCKYSPDKVDIWAVGVCAYYLVQGSFPFRGYDDKDLARKVREAEFQLRKGDQAFAQFLHRCLQVKPSLRATADELLRSNWLSTTRMDVQHSP